MSAESTSEAQTTPVLTTEPYTKLQLKTLEFPKSREEERNQDVRMKATLLQSTSMKVKLQLNPKAPTRLPTLSPISNQSYLYGVATDVVNSKSTLWTQPGLTVDRFNFEYDSWDYNYVHFNGLEFKLRHQSIWFRNSASSLPYIMDDYSNHSNGDKVPYLGSWRSCYMHFDDDLYDYESQESRWTFRPLTVENGVITMARFDLKYKNTDNNTNEYYAGSLIVKTTQSPSYVEYEFIPKVSVPTAEGGFDNYMQVNLENFDSDKQVAELVTTGAYTSSLTSFTDSHWEYIDMTMTNYGNETTTPYNSVVARVMNPTYGIFQAAIVPKKA